MVDVDDEMPSEETWNFDVHEEEEPCRREPPTTQPPRTLAVGEPLGGPTITADQAKQMEKIWLSRTEKLERRLLRAVESEQRARDQLALEGRNSTVFFLDEQRQLDALEASDFRLTRTIDALEQLQRTFSRHFLHSRTTADVSVSGFLHMYVSTWWS